MQENIFFRTYAHQANGYTETLNDALYAITSSPEWPYICKYFENKANKEQKYQEAACWEQGTIEYLRQLAVKKNVNINNIISSGIDFKNIKSLVQPALYDLNKAEQLYTYISNCVNEYNTYKKEHPQEIENLKPSKKDYVSLNPHAYLDMISQTGGTLRSLSNRMVSDHQAIYTTYEVGKQALIDSSFFIPGYGLAIGGGLWVANISTIEEQDKMIKYISSTGTSNFKNPDCKINLDVARPLTTDQNKRAGTTNYLSDKLPDNYDLEPLNTMQDGTCRTIKITF